MNLLIIGGTGVLSSAVVAEALQNGIEVTIVNRGRSGRKVPNGVKLIIADYRDYNHVKHLLDGFHYDAVIDFICYTPDQIEYSIDLLHSIADQYIFISSTCVYNTEIPGIKNEDSDKVLKSWDYSVNKWRCEEIVQERAKELGFNYTIIRPCVTYDDSRIPYGVMPPYGYHWTFIARILNGKPILRWDGGNTKWNMMRVEDFAIGVIGLVGNTNSYGEAFNISGDTAYSWNEVLECIESQISVSPIIVDITSEDYMKSCPNRKGEISGRSLDCIVDNTKIKIVVPSYTTTVSLQEGIKMTLEAYKTQNYQKGIDYAFDGDTDRIISSFLKRRDNNSINKTLGFVDYLGNSTTKDRVIYYLHKYNNPLFTMIHKLLRYFK